MALFEIWVHLNPDQRRAGSLPDFVKIGIDLPSDILIERHDATPEELSHPARTRAFGDAWLATARTAVLSVPSAIIPEEVNLLLNPLHPDFSRVIVAVQAPFNFDDRLAV